jgi:nucleoside-diphosphate-sugar epimerase
MGRTFLVTGGTGFIGSGLIKGLLQAGHRVRSLDNDSRGHVRRLGALAQDIERLTGDIRDPVGVQNAAKGVDAVAHLAYVNGTEFFYSRPELILDVAIKGMINVVDACRAENVPELILASSSEVYQSPPVVPTPEAVPLVVPDIHNPRYSYGGGKIACELMALHMAGRFMKKVVIFRPHNVYGPDMGREHVIPQFALRLRDLNHSQKTGRIPFPIQGNGSETRSFIFLDDAVQGILCSIECGEHLGVYHVGTEIERSIADVAHGVARCLGREIELVPGPLQKGSTPRRCPDIAKLKALGFAPQVSFEEGLAQTVRWYNEQAD